jgi:pimeloyl-ACP methyl ester carboxylesterase
MHAYPRCLAPPLLVILAFNLAAMPATQPATRPLRRGSFSLTFTDQSPLSPIEAQNKRWHIRIEPPERYKLSDESFQLQVPDDGDDHRPWGLLVWVSAGNSGNPPRAWLPVLQQRHLIWIGADHSGNDRATGVRFGLALDAVHNAKKLYPIDETRVYLAGVSGGAKVAGMLGVLYPDVFTGAIPISGVAYFRNIPVPGGTNQVWPAAFERPGSLLLDRARYKSRFVLLTGSNDFNRESIREIYEKGFMKDGFRNVEYVEVPDMGHGVPDPQWLDKAIESLDAPLLKASTKPATRPSSPSR